MVGTSGRKVRLQGAVVCSMPETRGTEQDGQAGGWAVVFAPDRFRGGGVLGTMRGERAGYECLLLSGHARCSGTFLGTE